MARDIYQAFPAVTAAQPGPANRFAFHVRNGHTTALSCPQDFVPFYFSSAGQVRAEWYLRATASRRREMHYDDYAGIDVKGKLVLILRHEPQETDEHSVFDGKKFTDTRHFSAARRATPRCTARPA